jgi:hypothetical protein
LHETQTVIGTRDVRGSLAYVIGYSQSAYNEGLQNYWTSGPSGDVFLYGFLSPGDPSISQPPYGVAYDPPVRQVDAPLYLGKTWSQTVRVYSLDADTLMFTWNITFTVVDESDLTVPAGTFHGFGIDYTITSSSGPETSPSGVARLDGARRLSPNDSYTVSTYAENVGLLQYFDGGPLQLARLDFPVPTLKKTWGALKALYKQ